MYEIYRTTSNYKKTIQHLNVVSLGCGPGSEVYGVIKAFRIMNMNVTIHYEGHDLIDVWEPVQRKVVESLSGLPHVINFHTSNLFADYHRFDDGRINLLVLNYLLSHASKFYSNQQKKQFINDILDFVIHNGVRNILFNDINYYGSYAALNSGTQLMKLLIYELRAAGVKHDVSYAYFPGDPYRGGEKWKGYKSGALMFSNLKGNTFTTNVGCCSSKQIFVHIQ